APPPALPASCRPTEHDWSLPRFRLRDIVTIRQLTWPDPLNIPEKNPKDDAPRVVELDRRMDRVKSSSMNHGRSLSPPGHLRLAFARGFGCHEAYGVPPACRRFYWCWTDRKREQARRTPYASRGSRAGFAAVALF